MKSTYRDRLRIMKKYIKLSVIAKEVGIPKNLLSLFMKFDAYDYVLSVDKLEALLNRIDNVLSVM